MRPLLISIASWHYGRVQKKSKPRPAPTLSNEDIRRNQESQRKTAADMVKLARKMKSEAIRIRQRLRRYA